MLQTTTINPADIANAQLGINLPLLYGYVRGRGNEVANHEQANKNRVVIRIAGEGECDGIDALFINSKRVNHLDTNLVHFHPGIDGVLGHGLLGDSTGGDQLVDTFWGLLPNNFIWTTFSRKCYLMFNVPPDPAAPSATLDIVFDLRALKVRQFDGSGSQTGYGFSTNGAEQILDVALRTMIKPEWSPSAAAAGGGDLTGSEKLRIDFPSFADSTTWCNQLLANGQKRFESSLAIVQGASVADIISQLATMSQLFVHEDSGVLYIRPDKPRSSSFTLSHHHCVAGKMDINKTSLHGAPNRFVVTYNDLNAADMADIDTPGNSGLQRSGTGFVTVLFKTNHPFTAGQFVQVCFPIDGSTHDAVFDGVFAVASLPASNKISYAQSGNANWLLWSEQFDNVAVWTAQTNVTVTANTTTDPLGGNTADTISTGASAPQGVFQSSGLTSTNGVQYTFSVWLRAAANTSVKLTIARPSADVETTTVTVTTVWQRFTFTHSATWTGAAAVQVIIQVVNSGTSIFAWGAQLEDGTVATTYRQTTNATSGVVSGNGYVGTPESRFEVRPPIINHEQHQLAIGQRGLNLTPIPRVVPLTLNFGNNTDERVRRALNFIKARKLGLDVSPYAAPWSGTILCNMDAVDSQNRALIAQLCGDIITIDSTVSEEFQGDYEIMKAVYNIPQSDGTIDGGSFDTIAPTIELTVLQYLSAAFSDVSQVAQPIRSSVATGLAPLASVDSLGIQRLRGTFGNNPTNVAGVMTGANPLSQSGTSTTILCASFSFQFGDGVVSYNSGSVNPGSYNTWFVYGRDPSFSGGSMTLFATTSKITLTQFNDVIFIGQITTSAGGGGTGLGGGGGACFSGNTYVRVKDGSMRFDELPEVCDINVAGSVRRARVIRSEYSGTMHDMGHGELVTPGHLIKVGSSYSPARNIWKRTVQYQGSVFTLHVETEIDSERCFELGNGCIAHNFSNL